MNYPNYFLRPKVLFPKKKLYENMTVFLKIIQAGAFQLTFDKISSKPHKKRTKKAETLAPF